MPDLGSIVDDFIVLDTVVVDCVVMDTILAKTCLNKTLPPVPVVISSKITSAKPDTIIVKWDRPMAPTTGVGAGTLVQVAGAAATGLPIVTVDPAHPKVMTIRMPQNFNCQIPVTWRFSGAGILLDTTGKDPGAGIHSAVNRSGWPSPTVITQPVDKTINYGKTSSLDIQSGSGATYQWYKDDILLIGATGANLLIPPLFRTSRFKCVVTNACGVTTSRIAVITVLNIRADDDTHSADTTLLTADRTL